MTTMDTQLGVVDEVTYGTPVTVTKFFEYNTWGVKLQQGRTVSAAMRPGGRTPHVERFEPYRIGAAGPFAMDVPTKGFGFWLKHMLGVVATGSIVDSNYTHTGTEGSLLGDMFTAQVNKPFHPAGTAQAHTYHGCKIPSWELACDIDGVLMFSGEIDAEDEDTSVALATASYPSDYRVFSFVGASATIDTVAAEVRDVKFGATIPMNVDRRYLKGSSLKSEPTENGLRTYPFSFLVDHSSLANYDIFRAAARVDTTMAIVATFNGAVAHGGTTLPSLVVTIPLGRVDTCDHDIAGPAGLVDAISGVAMWDGSASPITIAYTSTDATP